ncbi:sulfatase [Planctomycetia bacterium]|nr:sulfatase [Planctomycetia bacterium]
MRNSNVLLALLWLISSQSYATERPNIVFMLADDQGWNGLSVAMHPNVTGSKGDVFHTPNLERLAAQGMRFSAGYAPASVCSPTRISLMTGKSPAALHWTKAAPPETGHKLIEPRNVKSISANETTIAELLKQAGYATAHYGKWHIGGGGPEKHGFDESDGDTGNENAYQFKDPNPVDIFGMAERTEAFMERNSKAKKPFFIQLSWNALHAAENANKATLAKYEKALNGENSKRIATAAITEDLDTGVGRVLASIEKLGLSGNTFVIYMADNGANTGKKVLNGGKGGMWEGGIRVPFIVRGPGVKPNSWCHTRVVGYDLYPTFCEWAGIKAASLPKGLEGGSIAGLLANDGRGDVKRVREELIFHFPHYQGDAPHSAIMLGDLKLLHFYEDHHDELYDLAQDISERRDLAAQRPDDVKKLRDRLEKYLASVDAQLPTPNPDYDPNKEPSGKRGDKKPNPKKDKKKPK